MARLFQPNSPSVPWERYQLGQVNRNEMDVAPETEYSVTIGMTRDTDRQTDKESDR